MKKISQVFILVFASFSIQSFEDIYLECGNSEGYYDRVFGITQTLKQSLSSMGQRFDFVEIRIADQSRNDFATGYTQEGTADDNSISTGSGTLLYSLDYYLDRNTGKVYSLKYDKFSLQEQKANQRACYEEKRNTLKDTFGNSCEMLKKTGTRKTYLGSCSKISESTAKKYASRIYKPVAKKKKKF